MARTPPARRMTSKQLVDRLHQLRRHFTAEARAERLELLARLERSRLTSPAQLRRLHDELLFLLAFPDGPEAFAATALALSRFRQRIAKLGPTRRKSLEDSGIPGSVSRHVFVYGIARWLVDRFPEAAVIDWPALGDPDAFDALMVRFMTPVEADAIESAAIDTRQWLRAASTGAATDLAWVVREVARRFPVPRQGAVYDAGGVPVRWRLTGRATGVTHRPLVVHDVHVRTSMRRTPARPRALVATPLADIELLPTGIAAQVIDAARGALAARCREVHAISYANPHEVWLADLGEGAQLAVIGVRPALRMGLEANYGYVLFSNGVPIGYGGVSPLFFDANTGINIFDPFRGSEAGFLWTSMLRAFRTLFRTRRFIVNAYQFGAQNEEAIDSGAFWFYYRIGFRPADPVVRRVAAEEADRLRADPAYRSDRRTLRELASGDLHLTLPGFARTLAFEEAWLGDLAMAVARRIGGGDAGRLDAIGAIANEVARACGARGRGRWPLDQRRAFESLATLVAVIPGLETWPARARRELVTTMRAKGALQERDYVLATQRMPRLIAGLRRAVGH